MDDFRCNISVRYNPGPHQRAKDSQVTGLRQILAKEGIYASAA